MTDYYIKYIKYKTKYLQLKNKSLIGGASNWNIWFHYYEDDKITFSEKNIKKIDSIYTIKNPLSIISKNKIFAVYIFRKGIKPLLEDPMCQTSGNYRFNTKNKKKAAYIWNKIYNYYVSGVKQDDNIIGLRFMNYGDKYRIEIWTKKDEFDSYIVNKLKKLEISNNINFKKNEANLLNYSTENKLGKPVKKKEFDEPFLSHVNIRGYWITYLKNDTAIGHNLKKEIYWEIWMLECFKKYYKPNTNMIDIGANIGTTTLLMNEVLSDGNKIYSIEPEFVDILEMNLKRNMSSDRYKIFDFGIGDKEEVIQVNVIDRAKKQNFGEYSFVNISDKKVKKKDMQIKTLDSLDLHNISIIKIDVEGMEIQVLEGGKETIIREKPVIIIEILKENLDNFYNSSIWKKMHKNGYNIQKITYNYSKDDFLLIPSLTPE
jgi:FkbM family methyltransferase